MAINLGDLGTLAINLNNSAAKIRKQLVYLPVIGCKATLEHMTLRPGLRSNETVGQMAGDLQYGTYDSKRVDDGATAINPRTLEVFFGSVMKEFDPNQVATTIWGSDVTKGPAMTNAEIVNQIVPFLMGQLGKNLNNAIWNAKRKSGGAKTVDLFNGFDTITAAEITANKLAEANGNYKDMTAEFTAASAPDGDMVEFLQSLVFASSDELQGNEIEGAVAPKLFMPYSVFNKYNRDYARVIGSQQYSKEYTKRYVEGTNVELVPLVNKKGSNFLHLSTKSNMLVGCNQTGEEETCSIEKVPGLSLMLTSTMFWGTQFESIEKERLFVAKIKGE